MHSHTVESATLRTVAYDESSQQLHLEFRDGATYIYFDVPGFVYRALVGAPSKGQYFNMRVRNHFPHERLAGTAHPA